MSERPRCESSDAETEPFRPVPAMVSTASVRRGARALLRLVRGLGSSPSRREVVIPSEKPPSAPGEIILAGILRFVKGLVLGAVVSIAIAVYTASTGGPYVDVLVAADLAGCALGFCAGVALSGCAGALAGLLGVVEPEHASAAGCCSRVAGACRLAMMETASYESNVLKTGLAALVVLAWLGAMRGLTVAAAAAAGLSMGLAAGSAAGALFLIGVLLPLGVTLGAAGPCLSALLLGAAGCARFWIRWLQDRLLYHPRRYENDFDGCWGDLNDFGGQAFVMQKVSYSFAGMLTGDVAQTAFLLRPKGHEVGCLWVVHGGNAMLATDWFVPLDAMLRSTADPVRGHPLAGAAFLLIDYPGYGLNSGRPSPSAVLAASRAALREAVVALGCATAPKVHLLGHSLGCAAVIQLARKLVREGAPPGRLLLSAPFLNIPRCAERIVGSVLPGPVQLIFPPLVKLLVPHQWPNDVLIPHAAKAGWRIGIVHGVIDAIVPVTMGRELHRLAVAAGGPGASIVEVPKIGHNDVIISALPEYLKLMSFAAAGGGAQV